MHLFKTIRQVCDAEYRAALATRSPADPRKVVSSLPAPVRPSQRVNNPNETQWAAIGAFLADRVVNP
jgi:hypothetical protein